MTRVLITVEEFMDRYSISPDNLDYLAQHHGLVPFQWGLQTFLLFGAVDLDLRNMHMHAEMKAGLHRPQNFKRALQQKDKRS